MNKHILPLTYKPKIQDVIDGKCRQTIRPITSSVSKDVGDLIMFHGWSGKPYRSKWNWRTPYWKIIDAFNIEIHSDGMIWAGDGFHEPHNTYLIEGNEADELARLDGFKDYDSMYQQFVKMYSEDFLEKVIFRVIRWNPKIKVNL